MKNEEKLKVLIVEDDFLVSREIQRVLQSIGYRDITIAANGKAAVETAASMKPDAILMDIDMPGMDGIEAARLIQNQCPTPVVFLTAYQTDELVKKASQAGAGAFLTKPPDPGDISRAILVARARHHDLLLLKNLNKRLENEKQKLQDALEQIRTLQGILPICSSCKSVRNDSGYWEQVEIYFKKHSGVDFTHSMCPDCVNRLYPKYADNINEDET